MKPIEIVHILRRTWIVREVQDDGVKVVAYNNPVGALAKYFQKKLGR